MYEVSILFDGYLQEADKCETLEVAMKVLGELMQENLEVLASSSPRDIEKVTFQIEKKEVIFSVTY